MWGEKPRLGTGFRLSTTNISQACTHIHRAEFAVQGTEAPLEVCALRAEGDGGGAVLDVLVEAERGEATKGSEVQKNK